MRGEKGGKKAGRLISTCRRSGLQEVEELRCQHALKAGRNRHGVAGCAVTWKVAELERARREQAATS